MIQRRKTRPIQLGKVKVGGDAPITVQSMTKTDTRDVRATVQQIWDLEAAGCEIIRCAVPVREAALQLGDIKKRIRIPLVADIHFNYKLALIAIEQGVDGLRLNPGNIGARKYVEEVVRAASERKIPIRIGVNAGSLEKDLLQKYDGPTAAGMGVFFDDDLARIRFQFVDKLYRGTVLEKRVGLAKESKLGMIFRPDRLDVDDLAAGLAKTVQ